ncbi:MAG: hypothetical protein KBE23_22015, partial [Chloroflexi bacterium]|nr:hypothetical protein [Chloroflexota bacterium]
VGARPADETLAYVQPIFPAGLARCGGPTDTPGGRDGAGLRPPVWQGHCRAVPPLHVAYANERTRDRTKKCQPGLTVYRGLHATHPRPPRPPAASQSAQICPLRHFSAQFAPL